MDFVFEPFLKSICDENTGIKNQHTFVSVKRCFHRHKHRA